MIRGNAMDVYTVQFANGDICAVLCARDSNMKRLNAYELVPDHAIVAVHKLDEWADEHA